MNQVSEHVLLLMKSVHETLKMESRLEKAGIDFRTISRPRSAGKDCGLAIRTDVSDLDIARKIAEKCGCSIISVLEKKNGKWMERTE